MGKNSDTEWKFWNAVALRIPIHSKEIGIQGRNLICCGILKLNKENYKRKKKNINLNIQIRPIRLT